MKGVNRVTILGHLGQDPESRTTPGGTTVTNIRIATSDSWTDKASGEKREKTEWHSVVLWGRLGEIASQYLRKGSQVYIEGKLQTRKWQDRQGNDRYTTEIVAQEMQLLGGRGERRQSEPKPAAEVPGGGEFSDDIPFASAYQNFQH